MIVVNYSFLRVQYQHFESCFHRCANVLGRKNQESRGTTLSGMLNFLLFLLRPLAVVKSPLTSFSPPQPVFCRPSKIWKRGRSNLLSTLSFHRIPSFFHRSTWGNRSGGSVEKGKNKMKWLRTRDIPSDATPIYYPSFFTPSSPPLPLPLRPSQKVRFGIHSLVFPNQLLILPTPPFLILSSSSMCVCVCHRAFPFPPPSLSLSLQPLIAWASPGPSPPPPLSPSLPPLERPREKRDSSYSKSGAFNIAFGPSPLDLEDVDCPAKKK